MKNYIFFFLFFFILINISKAQTISVDEAYQIVLKNDSNILLQKDVFYSPTLLSANEKITNFKTVESPSYKSWFFFVDEFPFQSWEHPCYYMFINCETGEFQKITGTTPPKLGKMKVKVLQPMPEKGELFDFKKEKRLKSETTYDASNDYAVIISGGYDNENNWYRYWNDCSAIYSTLINVYNYSSSHIYVLISDGTSSGLDRVLSRTSDGQGGYIYTRESSPLDLDGDGTNDIQYSATKSNISFVFNTLSGIWDEEDHLFVFTTDHGGQSSGDDVYLYLWGETITDDEFATELNKVNAGKITVTMGQCHSGGFIDDLSADGRVISTACTATELSWAMSNATYDEYLYYWISAVAGETPEGTTVDADSNNDGWVSMQEAFEYAENADRQNEHPQYSSTPAGLGCFVRLSDNWNWEISGPTTVCSSGGTFTVNNLPAVDSIIWETGPYLTVSSGQNTNSCTISALSNTNCGNSWVQARLVTGCGSITLPPKTVWAGRPAISYVTGPTSNTIGTYSDYYTNVTGGRSDIISYNWDLNPVFANNVFTYSGNHSYIGWYTVYGYALSVNAQNSCGTSTTYYYPVYVNSSKSLSVSPNPASNDVQVTITEAPVASSISDITSDTTLVASQVMAADSKDTGTTYAVKMYNAFGILFYSTKKTGDTFTIPVSDLKDGIYVIEANDGKESYRKQFIVKH